MITNIEKVIDKALSEKFRQGKHTGKREVARKLLKMGFSSEEVSDITELPLSEISGLNELNK